MYELKSVKKKILRSRIDGANFTALIPFNPDNFQVKALHNLKTPEKSKDIFDLNSLIKFYEKRILKVFGLTQDSVSYRPNGLNIKETKNLGLYCDISRQSFDLKIHIQFKGLFFIKDDAYIKMKLYMQELINETDVWFRLTLIDIAKDIILKPWEVLPYKPEQLNKYHYNFRHKLRVFSESLKGQTFDTGFELYSGRFKIKVYDKRVENDSHKSLKKKEFYNNFYSSFKDERGSPLPISRFELTLRQEYCESFSSAVYDWSFSEERFISNMLFRFSKRHNLRERPSLFKDKNKSRWPITENWKDLFACNSEDLIQIQTPPNLRVSNPQRNLETLKQKLVEDLCLVDDFDSYRENPEKLFEFMKNTLNDAAKKRFEHSRNLFEQEQKVKKVKNQLSESQLRLLGDDL